MGGRQLEVRVAPLPEAAQPSHGVTSTSALIRRLDCEVRTVLAVIPILAILVTRVVSPHLGGAHGPWRSTRSPTGRPELLS